MPARVRVESLPNIELEGHVVSTTPLPVQKTWYTNDVKNFVSKIQLHVVPDGLLPGMTAEVEILTAQRPDALVVPIAALTVENGRDVCYVVNEYGIERRPVKVGEISEGELEITEGLSEGEEVVLEPSEVSTILTTFAAPSSQSPMPGERQLAADQVAQPSY